MDFVKQYEGSKKDREQKWEKKWQGERKKDVKKERVALSLY